MTSFALQKEVIPLWRRVCGGGGGSGRKTDGFSWVVQESSIFYIFHTLHNRHNIYNGLSGGECNIR